MNESGVKAPLVSGTQVISRAASLLREIAAGSRDGSRLSDLAAKLGLETPTAHRILRGLVFEGLVSQDPKARVYRLGPLTFELGLASSPHARLLGLCRDALDRVADDSGDVVFLIAPSGRETVCLDRRDGSYPVKAFMLEVGRRRPFGMGAGSIALLACYEADRARALVEANTERLATAGVKSAASVLAAVASARRLGYSMRETVEVRGISSLAVAVADRYGMPIAALSVSSLTIRIEQRRDQLLRGLQRESSAIARRLEP